MKIADITIHWHSVPASTVNSIKPAGPGTYSTYLPVLKLLGTDL